PVRHRRRRRLVQRREGGGQAFHERRQRRHDRRRIPLRRLRLLPLPERRVRSREPLPDPSEPERRGAISGGSGRARDAFHGLGEPHEHLAARPTPVLSRTAGGAGRRPPLLLRRSPPPRHPRTSLLRRPPLPPPTSLSQKTRPSRKKSLRE